MGQMTNEEALAKAQELKARLEEAVKPVLEIRDEAIANGLTITFNLNRDETTGKNTIQSIRIFRTVDLINAGAPK